MSRNDALPEALPYMTGDRRADSRAGRRDGRKQIPAYTGLVELIENEARITTPYQEQLSSTGRYQITEEFRRFLRRTESLQHQLSRLHGDLAAAQRAVARARDDLAAASAELTQDELLPRNPQEIPLAGTVALHSRRVAMRERRIAEASEELERRIGAAEGCQRHIDEVGGRIDHEFAVAQALGQRIGDYYVLRIATYWDALVKAHPEGRHLASLLPAVTPNLPAWVDGTCRGGVITLPPERTPGEGVGP
ncbi:hypothetical protein [Dactylosporangium sp. CA-139066]|uniref:hypothetical protein n=1 Tax=Dactylosporangium sp. CA-139066 TaxID=3239930 RepID=UPI003D912CEB